MRSFLTSIFTSKAKLDEVVPKVGDKSCEVNNFSDTHGIRCWLLKYEGVYLVLLNHDAQSTKNRNLLAFNIYGELLWQLEPNENDCIIEVIIRNGVLIACSHIGYNYQFDYKTGDVFETKYIK